VFVVLGPFGRTVLAHGNDTWQEYSYLGGMDAIALGCLTALMIARVRPVRRTLWILGGLGIASLIFILGFSLRSEAWGLDDCGLNMTLTALGTCMIIAAAAGTHWRSPRIAVPLLMLGRHSYEIYLTHMFVVFALYNLFVSAGSPLRVVPALFIGVIVAAALLGALVARFYSEPMNRLLRKHWGESAERLGSVMLSGSTSRPES
jgi:peptidoglycan/LPS O-acetylase OafA/YrhL